MVLDSTVVLNEIMYHPAEENAPEWIELYNQNAVNMDLSGWSLADGILYTFPRGTVLEGGKYLVIASDPEAMKAATGLSRVLGPFEGALSNGGEAVELRSNSDRLMDLLEYNDRDPWPVGPDGAGVTLAKIDQHSATALTSNWTASSQIGGTPGTANFVEPGTIVFDPLLGEGAPANALVPLDGSLAMTWTELGFDDSRWTHGTTGVGFDQQTTYDKLLGLDLDKPPGGQTPTPLMNINQSLFLRIPFDVSADLDTFDTLVLRMKFDDGFVAYLNGVEVAHANAPGRDGNNTNLGWFSGATASNRDQNAVQFADFNLTQHRQTFRPGENVLAIHGLNRSISDDDLLFLPLIEGGRQVKPDSGLFLALNEIAPGGDGFWVEMRNTGNQPIDMAGVVLAATGPAGGQIVLATQIVPPGQFLVVSAQQLGYRVDAGEELFLYEPAKERLLDAQIVTDRPRARSDAHAGRWLLPDMATPGGANHFQLHAEIVINEILYHAAPQYATSATPPTYDLTTIMPLDAVWRYNQSGTEFGPNWFRTTYPADGTRWLEGQGPLGLESGQGEEPIRTTLNKPSDNRPLFLTYYFQTEFEVNNIDNIDALQLIHLVNDGAIFYLNGAEVHRFNMPSGFVSALSQATQSVRRAEKVGPLTLPKELLKSGKNVLSAEVHLSSLRANDVAFGAQLLAGRETALGTAGIPFVESDEEWIELYNRHETATVDLSGWKLDDAVEFTFPQGTRLAPGQYLVVAKDPPALAAKHPSTLSTGRVLGPYDRTLSNRDERLLLVDAHGNMADEVHYYDAGRWHDYADGGGSSLELRDPRADNTKPDAWAPSDESGVLGRSSWQHYSYTPTVESLVYDPPISFHEFHMGMLDRGEVLLDNISVIEDPGGANIQLIQNGDYQQDEPGSAAGKWRIQGTHEDSRVVADPDNPANKVLHLVAEARTNYFGNHAETTLANRERVDNGKTYQISFDAKWVAGSPQLHTELYYKDAVRTTIVSMPEQTGTPGARNSRFEPNIGPTFRQLRHEPAIPKASEPVTITVMPDDPDAVASVSLLWGVDGGQFTRTSMAAMADGAYSAAIPAQRDGAVVQFFVEATDGRQATSIYPPAGPESRALYKVDDDFKPDPIRHDFHIIMLPDDARNLHAQTEWIDNDRTGSTVIYRAKEIFYDVGTRLKGSMFSRNDATRAGLNLLFHPDQRFRGVHENMTLDRANEQEILVKHLIQSAGMLGGMYDDVVNLRSPRGMGDGPTPLQMARHGQIYLDEQFDNGSDGTVYKFEGIRVMTNTVDGRPESVKIYQPIGWVSQFDITDLGDDKELYRWPFLITNNRAKDDFTRMIDLAKAFGMQGRELQEAVAQVLDVNQWMQTFAMMSLAGIGDVYSQGNPHNLSFYQRPEDNKMLVFPWDWDFTFSQGARSPLQGGSNIGKIIRLPVYQRLFQGHMLQLINSVFNADYMAEWLDHYGTMLSTSFVANNNYIRQRGDYVLSQLAEEVPFQITTHDGQPWDTTQSTFRLEGKGWINVREIRLAGSEQPLPVIWTGVDQWQVDLALVLGANSIQLEAYDAQGALIGTDQIVITSNPDAVLGDVLVSEVHYHNARLPDRSLEEPHVFEFVELFNRGDEPLNLSGWRLAGDVQFDFPQGTSVGAGQTLLIFPFAPGDLAKKFSLELLYGVTSASLNLAGPYAGELADQGGMLRLERPTGDPTGPPSGAGYVLADEVVYDDEAPWPLGASGHGGSLARLPLARFGASSSAWTADTPSPGRADLVLRELGDVNDDGQFSMADLTLALQGGKYLADQPASWSEGDWNGDGLFNQLDLVFALQEGRFS